MITVKLYGLLRLETGIRELRLEAKTVRELLTRLELRGISKKQLSGCCVLLNGKNISGNAKLSPEDTVQLFPPVAGG